MLKSVPQGRWRFTSGALLPDGFIQIIALFAVGLEVKTMMLPLVSLCFIAWLASLVFYGWQWDRRRHLKEITVEISDAHRSAVIAE